MNIAFDIDGVITDIELYLKKNGKKFLKKEIKNNEGYNLKEIFECNDKEYNKFWTKYFLDYFTKTRVRDGVSDLIKDLKKKEDNIYIISGNVFTDRNDYIGLLARRLVKKFLKRNNIDYDKIIFCNEDDDKKEICERNHIDILIEDKKETIIKNSKSRDVLCMDASYNKNCNGNNIHRIYSLPQASFEIEKIRENKNKKIKKEDIIKPISGNPAIDKNWLQYYPVKFNDLKQINLTMYEMISHYNQDNMDVEAINYFGKKLTFKEFLSKIDKCARAFQNMGVKKGDIVPICMSNTPEAVISVYALNKIGAVADMIFPLSSKEEFKTYLSEIDNTKPFVMIDLIYEQVKDILDDLDFKNVIVTPVSISMPYLLKNGYNMTQSIHKFVKKHGLIGNEKIKKFIDEKTQKEINKIYTSKIPFEDGKYIKWDNFIKLSKNEKETNYQKFEKDRVAIIVHTGGTTGSSKGVVLTNENINSYVEQFRMNGGRFKVGDRMLAVMPLFHGFGLCSSIHIPLCFGVSTVLVPKVNNSKVDELFNKYKPNYIIAVPTFWKSVLKNEKLENEDFSYVKYLVTGGDAMDEKLEANINKFFEDRGSKAIVYKGYGLSEAVAGVTFAFNGCNKKGSIGIPMYGNDFKIVDIDTKEELSNNMEGEFCLSGPTVMKEYLNNNEETNMVIEIDKNGKRWLHTGDMGYIDDDGVFYYTQRKKRMLVSSGHNVYPRQIEDVILSNDNVESCTVVGLKHCYKGTVPKAYIVLKKGIELDKDISLQIKASFNKNLSRHSIPTELEFVTSEQIPLTKYGKVDYMKLTDIANNKEKPKVLSLK